MLKRILCICICMMMCTIYHLSHAAGLSNIKIIGFSEDGQYLAFENTFYDDQNETGYRKVRFIELAKNHFAETIVLWDGNKESQNKDKNKAYDKIDRMFDKFQIKIGNTGKRVFHDTYFAHPLNYQKPEAKKKINRTVKFSLQSENGKEKEYQVILQEFHVKKSKCTLLSANQINPKILTLAVIDKRSIKILQKDKKLYESRRCPYAYGVHQVIVYKDKMAVFLDSWTMGSQGINIHKLAVTGKLP